MKKAIHTFIGFTEFTGFATVPLHVGHRVHGTVALILPERAVLPHILTNISLCYKHKSQNLHELSTSNFIPYRKSMLSTCLSSFTCCASSTGLFTIEIHESGRGIAVSPLGPEITVVVSVLTAFCIVKEIQLYFSVILLHTFMYRDLFTGNMFSLFCLWSFDKRFIRCLNRELIKVVSRKVWFVDKFTWHGSFRCWGGPVCWGYGWFVGDDIAFVTHPQWVCRVIRWTVTLTVLSLETLPRTLDRWTVFCRI